MSDLLKGFVATEVKRRLQSDLPHLRHPVAVYAKVTGINQGSVNLRILDKNKRVDKSYPEMPYVRTDLDLKYGDVVAAALLYGECIPYILGRVMG